MHALSLLAIGAIVAGWCTLARRQLPGQGKALGMSRLFTLVVYGLASNYSLLLLGAPIAALVVGSLVVASAVPIVARWRSLSFPVASSQSRLFIVLVAIVLSLTVLYPLKVGDARNIWFFHAKMIYWEGSLSEACGLTHPQLAWSHPGYPKLVSGLAAQMAATFGVWNEYVPKFAISLLVSLAAVGYAGFRRVSWRELGLLAGLLALFQMLLFNGYVDGVLALYTAIALLYLGEYLEEFDDRYLRPGLAALGLTVLLKNEGLLGMLIIALLCAVVARKQLRRGLRWSHVACLIPLLPAALWLIIARGWGLAAGPLASDSLALAAERLRMGKPVLLIMSHILSFPSWPILALAVLSLLPAIWRRSPRGAAFAVAFLVLYLLGLLIAYLLHSPYGPDTEDNSYRLQLLLEQSASRVVMPALAAGAVGIYWAVRGLFEPRLRAREPRPSDLRDAVG